MAGETIADGNLLIEDGRITAMGLEIEVPAGARIIDAQGKYVYPGIVALMSTIGLTGYPGAGSDTNETGVVTAQVDPYDALNPEDETIEVTRMGGVTTGHTISGTRNVINGKSMILKLDGDLAAEMIVRRDVAQVFNLGAKRQNKYPSTISGTMALLRERIEAARLYNDKKKKSAEAGEKAGKGTPFKRDPVLEALLPVVNGEMRVVLITNSEMTLRNALQLVEDYNLNAVIQAGEGIHKFIARLAERKIPVIWTGATNVPRKGEAFDLYYQTAARLSKAGVLFAFATGGFGGSSRNVRNLPVPAALSVAYGLSEEEAIKAMTINPARMLGIDDLVGSLEVGKQANVAIWSGSPIQLRSRVETVIIDGREVPLTSFQTRLRDKFFPIVRERLKK